MWSSAEVPPVVLAARRAYGYMAAQTYLATKKELSQADKLPGHASLAAHRCPPPTQTKHTDVIDCDWRLRVPDQDGVQDLQLVSLPRRLQCS